MQWQECQRYMWEEIIKILFAAYLQIWSKSEKFKAKFVVPSFWFIFECVILLTHFFKECITYIRCTHIICERYIESWSQANFTACLPNKEQRTLKDEQLNQPNGGLWWPVSFFKYNIATLFWLCEICLYLSEVICQDQ